MVTTEEFMRRVEEIQAARRMSIAQLVDVLAERKRLQDALADTDGPYGKAYTAAEAGGWTAEDLKALGAEEPAKRPKGRPRKRSTAPPKAASSSSATAEATAHAPAPPASEPPMLQIVPDSLKIRSD